MTTCFDIANYFIWTARSSGAFLDALKLQKILFFSQGWYLSLYKKPLFSDDFQAWQYGPAIPILYSQYKAFGRKSITIDIEKPLLETEVENLLLFVGQNFLLKNSGLLSGITHKKDSPWKTIRDKNNCSSKDACQDIIPKDLIQKYYDEMINDQDLNEPFPMIDSFLDFLISTINSDFSNCLQYTSDMLKDDKALLVSIFGD